MADVTFRDFAFAAMQKQTDVAAGHLETLLGIEAATARTATEVFQGKAGDPAFMPKAMGLRTAVASGSDAEIAALLADLFGLDAAACTTGVATLRARKA